MKSIDTATSNIKLSPGETELVRLFRHLDFEEQSFTLDWLQVHCEERPARGKPHLALVASRSQSFEKKSPKR